VKRRDFITLLGGVAAANSPRSRRFSKPTRGWRHFKLCGCRRPSAVKPDADAAYTSGSNALRSAFLHLLLQPRARNTRAWADQLNCLSSKACAGHKQPHAAGFSMIKFPSSSTLSPVFLASSSTEGCQSTLPASGPPMIAIKSASGASVRLLKPR
jgi:hypothetical protein